MSVMEIKHMAQITTVTINRDNLKHDKSLIDRSNTFHNRNGIARTEKYISIEVGSLTDPGASNPKPATKMANILGKKATAEKTVIAHIINRLRPSAGFASGARKLTPRNSPQ